MFPQSEEYHAFDIMWSGAKHGIDFITAEVQTQNIITKVIQLNVQLLPNQLAAWSARIPMLPVNEDFFGETS